jgi:hypothetical protein
MENQLFDWEGWDQQDTMAFTFYRPTLKVDIGPFKAGQTLSVANINYERGWLQVQAEDGTFHDEKIGLCLLGSSELESAGIAGT